MHSTSPVLVTSLLVSLSAFAAPPVPPDEAAQPVAAQPASARFPEGEKLLKKASAELALTIGKPPPLVMKQFVMNKEWGMVRSPDGIITGRVLETVVFFKGGESGRCTQRLCSLSEQEQGSKWGKPSLDCVESLTIRVQCKSVDALKGGK